MWIRLVQLTLVLFGGVAINAAVFFGQDRFRAPVDPLLLLMMGVGLFTVVGLLRGK